MGVEGLQAPRVSLGQHIVEQEAHADATVRRVQEPGEEERARPARVDEVVLDVDGALGEICQRDPRSQGVHPVRKELETGLAGMPRGGGLHGAPQPRIAGVLEGRAVRPGRIEVDARTRHGQRGGRGQQQMDPEPHAPSGTAHSPLAHGGTLARMGRLSRRPPPGRPLEPQALRRVTCAPADPSTA